MNLEFSAQDATIVKILLHLACCAHGTDKTGNRWGLNVAAAAVALTDRIETAERAEAKQKLELVRSEPANMSTEA